MSENDTPERDESQVASDEQWKEQVQAEKEAAAAAAAKRQTEKEASKIPPASFELLISSLATQSMFALGLIPDPSSGKASVRLDLAKHNIDMLAVLEEKTEGNRTPQESEAVSRTLHELRMLYVEVAKSAPAEPEEPEQRESKIVLP